MGLRNPEKFCPVSRQLNIHTRGRYIMDVDHFIVNYARGFVCHVESKRWTERAIDPKQIATIRMIADVWSRSDGIFRDYDDGFSIHRHSLTYRGYYILRCGDEEVTNADPYELMIIRRNEIVEMNGDSGAAIIIHDIARGAI